MSDSALKKGRFTKFSNRIGLYSNQTGNYVANTPEVVLNFPFKDTVLEGGMTKEDSGRDERFLHIEIDRKDIDTLEDPKVLTNFKYVDENGETELTASSDIEFFDEKGNLKQNLLIKGNNLLALYSLREKLAGKIKLIYIDPPYNTGNDGFKYNDNFNHSAWLTFMKNRLEIAHDLLKNDGVLFIQCDDNEQAYLKVLMDETFGRENFIANFIWQKKTGASDAKNIATITEYTLLYAKNLQPNMCKFNEESFDINRYRLSDEYEQERGKYYIDNLDRGGLSYSDSLNYPITCPDGTVTYPNGRKEFVNEGWIWKWSKDKFKWAIENSFIEFRKSTTKESGWAVCYKNYIKVDNEGKPITRSAPYKNLILDVLNNDAAKEIKGLFGSKAFSYPKPEKLIQKYLSICSEPGDIVLDFCLGSGTTASVAHKMNRRWIGIEQMDYIETVSKARLKKVIDGEQGGISKDVNWQGGGSFVYMELKKYNQDFLDRLMEVTSIPDVEAVYEDMQKNAFLKFFFDKREFEKDENFRSKTWEERRDMLVEILDENQLYLNLQDMRDSKHKVSNDEMVLTDRFYGVKEDGEN